eukprot:CAMPEP_0194484382 /NCGR_PEP_ID=MMETSP0253-20130528/5711_1 /TAXON_ID=2966 /ORGANISM="Noctiluca scintillans" /LENGTH=61 /DNA_ID=CAMNT_0039324175 /DNA_START=13 /DNA_END=194 /DNA_ORIENTATION=-
MGGMGGMGGMNMDGMAGMDGGSDDEMDDCDPPAELPEGIQKESITVASTGNWKKPKAGDEV